MKQFIKKTLRNIIFSRSDKHQKSYAEKIMKCNKIENITIEGEAAYIKAWKPLSKNIDPIYYRCFSHYAGKNPHIIPANLCVQIVEPILNPVRYRDYYSDKNIYGKMYSSEMLPKTYLRRMNGIYMDEEYNVLQTIDAQQLFELLKGVEKFIIKPSIDSESGRGVSLYRQTDRQTEYIDQDGTLFSLENVIKAYGDNFIIQACLSQSPFISQFNFSSINTIRMVAYRSVTDNTVHITNAILRIGAAKAVVDNAHAGGKFVGINDDGSLGKYACDFLGRKSDSFNCIDFSKNQFIIPNYDLIKEFGKKVANEIPHHRLIALDIALDENNTPSLIEYNVGGFGYWLFQFVGQNIFNDRMPEVIEYCAARNGKQTFALLKI